MNFVTNVVAVLPFNFLFFKVTFLRYHKASNRQREQNDTLLYAETSVDKPAVPYT